MTRRRKPAHERHICAPLSYPVVHDCGRPETCTDTDRVWGCEIAAYPPADAPGSLYWVGDEREIWTRGPDLARDRFSGLYDPAGAFVPWEKARAIFLKRGARIAYTARVCENFGEARARADIGAPLLDVRDMPAQMEPL